MNDFIHLTVPAKTKYISAVRLAVSSACSDLEFDISRIDDLKSCISESCILLMCRQTQKEIEVMCEISRDIKVMINGNGGEKNEDYECACNELNEEISKVMIKSLADSCDIEEKDGLIEKIVFEIKAGE